MACIQRPSFSILINGDRTDYFHSEIGLRQGCPLSPFLFVLAADALSRALHQAQQDSALDPYRAGPQGPSISHLLFADDCIFLGRASEANATVFASILQTYCLASGQKVNNSKSVICFSPRVSLSRKGSIMQIMGISMQSDWLSYLGIPITGKRPRISDFSNLERRIRDRLDGWQVTGLSMMARITLIRSVLTSLPLYLLSNAAVPLTCLRKIERYFRDFLWGSSQDGHAVHLLAWDCVCLPISEGGLGIQSLTVRREALLARHASRFLLDPHCMWSSFMRSKYGDWTSSTNLQPARGHSFFWKEVCNHAPDILHSISWIIGNGASVDVAYDSWITDLPLSRWPTFVSTSIPPGMRVSDLTAHDHSSWSTPLLSRFFGEELLHRIVSIPLSTGHSPDIRVWRRSCLPRAPIRDLLQIYRAPSQPLSDMSWIWRFPIHPRVRLFLWKLARNCLPTCSVLSRRGLGIQPTCPLCGMEDESVDHAIFTCLRASHIWGIARDRPWDGASSSYCLSFLCMIRQDVRRGCWKQGSTRAYIAYQIWLSRNRIIFSHDSAPSYRVVRVALSLSTEYSSHRLDCNFDSPGPWGSHAAPAAHRRTVFISWEPPPPGFVKINFDGSVRGRSAGSGYVIRRSDGALLSAGGFSHLDSSVPLAELYAAWAGVSCAIRCLGARRIILEGDALIVIRWLRQDSCNHLPTNPLISDIRSLLQGVHCIQICHTFREANSAADWIAARVADHSGFWRWQPGDRCPPILNQLLYSDRLGLSHPRQV